MFQKSGFTGSGRCSPQQERPTAHIAISVYPKSLIDASFMNAIRLMERMLIKLKYKMLNAEFLPVDRQVKGEGSCTFTFYI